MTWVTLIIAGIITFLLRFSMIALIKENSLSEKTKIVLSYVPSAVFPAIIFPAIFLDNSGLLDLENNPKILASIIAIIAGFMSKNIIATIFAGLASYWFLIL
jgi:branched-subunit amino acid transport protein